MAASIFYAAWLLLFSYGASRMWSNDRGFAVAYGIVANIVPAVWFARLVA